MKEARNKILIFSDLDNTLWQSNKVYQPTLLDLKISNDENSYMNSKQMWLYNFLHNENSIFIPTTARNQEQYERTFLHKKNYPFVILNLGHTLLINNEIDKEWKSIMDTLFIESNYTQDTLNDINNQLQKNFKIQLENKKHPYAYKKIDDIVLFNEVQQFLFQYNKNIDLEVANSRNVIFFKPVKLDKELCVSYLIDKLKPELSIGLGDSLMDRKFLKKTDFFFIPKNSELGSR